MAHRVGSKIRLWFGKLSIGVVFTSVADSMIEGIRHPDPGTALSENGVRELEFAFRCYPFVLFRDTLEAVARVVGIPV